MEDPLFICGDYPAPRGRVGTQTCVGPPHSLNTHAIRTHECWKFHGKFYTVTLFMQQLQPGMCKMAKKWADRTRLVVQFKSLINMNWRLWGGTGSAG